MVGGVKPRMSGPKNQQCSWERVIKTTRYWFPTWLHHFTMSMTVMFKFSTWLIFPIHCLRLALCNGAFVTGFQTMKVKNHETTLDLFFKGKYEDVRDKVRRASSLSASQAEARTPSVYTVRLQASESNVSCGVCRRIIKRSRVDEGTPPLGPGWGFLRDLRGRGERKRERVETCFARENVQRSTNTLHAPREKRQRIPHGFFPPSILLSSTPPLIPLLLSFGCGNSSQNIWTI